MEQQLYETRNLTLDESAALLRALTVQIGHNGTMAALRVIAEQGCGIFKPTGAEQ